MIKHLCESCVHGLVYQRKGVKYVFYPNVTTNYERLTTDCKYKNQYKSKRLLVSICEHYQLKVNCVVKIENRKEVQVTLYDQRP